MTREEAKDILYQLINSGILDEELQANLEELAEHICQNDFEECVGNEYCKADECQFLKN